MNKLCARVITLFVLVTMISACAVQKIPETLTYTVDSEVEPYVQAFVKEAAKHGASLTQLDKLHVLFVPSFNGQTFIATCTQYYQKPTIHISEAQWSNKSEIEKEIIMFHELGHCLLLKGHNETVIQSIPTSIMFPIQLDEGIYEPRRQDYLNELFGQ